MNHFNNNLIPNDKNSNEIQIHNQEIGIDSNYLQQKLQLILQTIQEEKEDLESKFQSQKFLLEQKIQIQSEKILELQSKNQLIQQQSRRIRFNYSQRGSVVDYLKKKMIALETKFDSEKQEMISVIKYLESRNSQLNEVIFQLKNTQNTLNKTIQNLQQKYLTLVNDINQKQFDQKQNFSLNYSLMPPQKRFFPRATGSLTPKYLPKRHNQLKVPYRHLPSNSAVLALLSDSPGQSLSGSQNQQKTIRYEPVLSRISSNESLNLTNMMPQKIATHRDKLDYKPVKQTGKNALNNRLNCLRFGDYSNQTRVVQQHTQKFLNKPKLSLPNQRGFTQLLRQNNQQI